MRRLIRSFVFAGAALCWSAAAFGQVTPAAGYTPPDDTPAIRIGMTLWPNFTEQTNPDVNDADGNPVNKSAFDVGRAYINITGQLSHIIQFRITPDISREGQTATPAPTLNGSLVYRIKYAFGQFNLDDWMARGSWARFGIQQTPWVDFEEGIYRYRFQGTVFAERVPLPTTISSSDAGASFYYNFAKNYGGVHVGVYNGENYNKTDGGSQKAFEVRGTVRPLATSQPVLRGLRVHLFYMGDHYAKSDDKERFIFSTTYEHPYVNAGYDYLNATDQVNAASAKVESNGYSFWLTPKYPRPDGSSFEALIRYDHWTPNSSSDLATNGSILNDQKQNRTIFGGAYWFPHQGNVSAAILFDYDAQSFDNITTPAPVKVFGIHGLLNF